MCMIYIEKNDNKKSRIYTTKLSLMELKCTSVHVSILCIVNLSQNFEICNIKLDYILIYNIDDLFLSKKIKYK